MHELFIAIAVVYFVIVLILGLLASGVGDE